MGMESPDETPAPGEGALVTIADHGGQPAPRWAIPRRPRITLALDMDAPQQAVWLLSGAADDELVQDASASPLRKATLQRTVETIWTQHSDGWTLEPERPLARDATYTLLVGRWALMPGAAAILPRPLPWAIELRASGDATDGAAIRHAWPADASPAVPTDLARVHVTLDGHVTNAAGASFTLRDAGGEALDVDTEEWDCGRIDSGADHCIGLSLRHALEPLADYRVQLEPGATDLRGAPLQPWSSTFRTAQGPSPSAPRLSAIQCNADEVDAQGVCIFADDMRVQLRLRALGPALLRLRSGQLGQAVIASRGEATFTIDGLPPQQAIDVQIELEGAAGRVDLWRGEARTLAALATLAITEVRSDPRGPEPDQEYVELLNFGTTVQSLAGLSLSDAIDGVGAPVTHAIDVPPGTRVLLVADDFDPEHPLDGVIAAGVPLVRVGKSLGQSGLSNTGEPVYLRDVAGQRISAAPPTRTGSGGCLVRIATDPRTGVADAFAVRDGEACTPGR